VKRNWGWWILCLSITGAFVALLIRPVGGHYISFYKAALLAWSGQNPFGIPFAGGIFFYSPAAAYFYGLYAYFPPPLGQFLYVASGVAVFAWGMFSLLGALREKLGFDIRQATGKNLFWLMVSSELTGAIGAMKLEILLSGFTLLAFSALLRNQRLALAGALLGIGSQWKFQPIPLFGLALVVLVLDRRPWRYLAGYMAMIAALAGMPFALLPVATVGEWYARWWAVLSTYTDKAWLAPIYQHVFRFSHVCLGWTPTRFGANVFTVICAVVLAVGLGAWFILRARKISKPKAATEALLAAMALGSFFITVLSPHTQSNGYILNQPALPARWYFGLSSGKKARGKLALYAVCYFFISIAYSDLVPKGFYHWVYEHALKPVAASALAAALIYEMVQRLISSLPTVKSKPGARRD